MNIQQQLFPTLRRRAIRSLAAAFALVLASCTGGMDDTLTPPDAGQQTSGEGISFEITIAPPSGQATLLTKAGQERTTPVPSLVRRGTENTPAPTRAEEPSSGTPLAKEGTGELSSSSLTATAYLLPEPSAPQTRASVPLTPEDSKYKAIWETGDAIGIFAVEIGSPLATTGNPIHNVRLTMQADGTWKPDPGTTLFWPRTDKQYNFAAYYPYTTDMDDAVHHFTVATNQDKEDPATGKTGFDASVLLFGTTADACTRGNVVSLTLRHATTMVVLSLDDRISALDLSRDLTVTLRGVNTSVSCSPSAAALQPSAGSTSGDIVMQRVEQPETPAYRSRFTFRALIPSTNTVVPDAQALFRIRNGGLLIDATAAYPAATTADAPAYHFTCPIPADAKPL